MPPPSSSCARVSVAVWLGLGLAAALLGWALIGGASLRELSDRGIGVLRAAGPVAFFAAMAVIPAPLLWFTIPAGEAFAGELTLGGVIVAASLAAGIQIAVMYWIARYGLRPRIEAWIRRRGHSIPRVTPENALRVTLLVRFTPGPPMVVGCFVLGLAEVPFRLYLLVSWLVAVPWVIAGVAIGRGLWQGDFTLAATGIGILVIVVVGLAGWRSRQRRRALAARVAGRHNAAE